MFIPLALIVGFVTSIGVFEEVVVPTANKAIDFAKPLVERTIDFVKPSE